MTWKAGGPRTGGRNSRRVTGANVKGRAAKAAGRHTPVQAKGAVVSVSLSKLSAHKGQWFSARCKRPAPSDSLPDVPAWGPFAVLQISVQAAASADRAAKACDTAGASSAHAIAIKAIQACKRLTRERFMAAQQAADEEQTQCFIPACPPAAAGAAMLTGILTSCLLSMPLASLKTKVTSTMVSLTSGAFRSISMTW